MTSQEVTQMSEEDEMETFSSSGQNTKKRKVMGRLAEVNKKLRVLTHESGSDCRCKRFKCFEEISAGERSILLKDFNLLESKNNQSAYLSGLISIHPIQRRRPRKDESVSNLRNHSFSYKVRVIKEMGAVEIPVCRQALLAIFGISSQTIKTIQQSLTSTGKSPIDQRGKHSNRKHKKSGETVAKVHSHIQSLKGRKAHYSMHDSRKLYLPEELSIKKLHRMYTEVYPEHPVSHEFYRNVFNTQYNISFGYPRTDTCSSCDEYKAKATCLQKEKETCSAEDLVEKDKELRRLSILNEVHLKKANIFYVRKRLAKKKARTTENYEAICMDFMKNLPVPNLSTNDVYYKRQLSFYMFNIHVLSTGAAYFFTYDQTVAKKGADDVVSMLDYFCKNILSPQVRHLDIFCDSCAGQNKNFTLIRFLHHLVHKVQRFDTIQVTFPVRGHSYMECDKNMGLIKTNVQIELPSQWNEHVQSSRIKPSPFSVIACDRSLFKDWGKHLMRYYKKKSPFHTRPITQILFEKNYSRTISLRDSYSGSWESHVIMDAITKRPNNTSVPEESPKLLYNAPIPIAKAKYDNIMFLSRFCGAEARLFYQNLQSANQTEEDTMEGYPQPLNRDAE